MSIEKNRKLMIEQIKRLRSELNEKVFDWQRDNMLDSSLKPGMKITSIKDIGNGDYAELVINGKKYSVATGGGASLNYEGDWDRGQKFKPGVIKSIETPDTSAIVINLKDGRVLEFIDDTGGEGVEISKD